MKQFKEILEQKKKDGTFRFLQPIDEIEGLHKEERCRFLNLSSNDYLSLGTDSFLREEFLRDQNPEMMRFTASSSRLLTGNSNEYIALERTLCNLYGSEAALVVGSGYHANSGILPAISNERTLILADKLVHASLIDGIRLSKGKALRYRHNDYEQLERLIRLNSAFERIIIVTESVFSMDGDRADIKRLVALKKKYPQILLYIDEAHGVGVYGERGLGVCEETDCLRNVDILVGTFGKALASTGAFIICNRILYDFLVNTLRTLIFTTALPPLNLAWTRFILEKLPEWQSKRERLHQLSARMHEFIKTRQQPEVSTTHIIPYFVGDNAASVKLAAQLQEEGFHVMAVRPPTVPEGSARLRISLCAGITDEAMESFITILQKHTETNE